MQFAPWMINTKKTWIPWAPLLSATMSLCALSSQAEESVKSPDSTRDETAFLDMSLEDLLNVEVDVVSKSSGQQQNIREVPGIVTVISREQIIRTAPKDLLEILRQVPGFQIGGDGSNTYYAGVRGLYALDGKMLVLVDGHEMNELLYSSVNLGNRFPVDWIERIEIIRGPGSVMYGGSAAYGVINIVTRSAEEMNGVSATASYSQMLEGVTKEGQSLSDTYGQRYVSLSGGRMFKPDKNLGLTLDAFASQGMMSDRTYTDMYGDSFNMAGNSETGSIWGKAKFTYKDLTVGYLYERYRTTTKDGWGMNLDEPIPSYYTTSSLDIRYEGHVTDHTALIPRLTWLFEKPWETTAEEAKAYFLYWDPSIHRVTPSLTLRFVPKDWLYLSATAEYQYEYVKDEFYGFEPDMCTLDYYGNKADDDCTTSGSYHNFALFGEGIIHTKPMDISLGVRYEYNSAAGSDAVPRIALTKAFEHFHFKLLGSQAFRAPTVNNLSMNPDLERDKTTVGEAELGFKPTRFLFWTINGFLIHVNDPIVYFYDEASGETSFMNYKQTGTAGFETALTFKLDGHFIEINYSYYHPVFNDVEIYNVPGHDNVLLAFAKHKLAMTGGLELIRNLTLNISWSLLFGDRYGYVSIDENGDSQLQKFDPEFVSDIYLLYRNFPFKGFSIGLGGRNISNGKTWYIQPYDAGHAPNPGSSAEVFLKLGYDFAAKR
jgi:outer membrane cobalamin receptor